MAILDRLEARERVSLCYEHAHNTVQNGFARATGAAPTAKQAAWLQEQDSTGALTLKHNFGRLSGYAHKALLHFLLDRNIPTRFTDASSPGKDFDSRVLDANDGSTAASLRACFGREARRDIAPETPEGIRVRNHHMATHALDFAKATKARIVIQLTGSFHVTGRAPNYPARDGLAANFKALGAPAMALLRPTKDFQEKDIPADHGLGSEEMLIARGLPEKPADLSPPEQAAAGAAKLLAQSGFGDAAAAIEGYSRVNQQYEAEVGQAFAAAKKIVPGVVGLNRKNPG